MHEVHDRSQLLRSRFVPFHHPLVRLPVLCFLFCALPLSSPRHHALVPGARCRRPCLMPIDSATVLMGHGRGWLSTPKLFIFVSFSTLGGFHVTSFLQRCWPFLDCCNLGFAHLNFLSRDNKTKKHNLMCANGALLKIGAVHG
ncbi:uncharacterized protein [Setaria viridis]|nr:uncharacterized protein LOC117847888 isoform X1 [Setaria viridis]